MPLKPKAYTAEESRRMFLAYLRHMRDYWSEPARSTEKDRMDGMVFSILAAIDGCSMALPAFDLRAAPHSEDKAFCIGRGERWWNSGLLINDCQLHEEWVKLNKLPAGTNWIGADI